MGCEQECVAAPILRDLPECDELGSGRDHALCFEQQVLQVLISTPAVDQQTEFGVDAFHYAKPYFGAAVVENPVQMIGQHVGQFLKGRQALPAELICPSFQVAHRRVFVLIIPEMVQASFNGSEQEFAGEGHFTRLSSHW
jgi:hypothetical protein